MKKAKKLTYFPSDCSDSNFFLLLWAGSECQKQSANFINNKRNYSIESTNRLDCKVELVRIVF